MKNEKFMTDDMIKVKRYFEDKVEEDFLLALNQYEKAKTSLAIALPHTNEKGFKVNQIAKKEIRIIKDYWYDRMELLIHYVSRDLLEKNNYYDIIK